MNQVYYLQLHGKLSLNHSNPFAKISLRWVNDVEQHKWYIGLNGYPFAYIYGCRVHLHRFIHWLNVRYWTDLIVDHIDRDKFNATDSNLREATAKQNSYNKTHTNPNHNIKYNESTGKFTVSIQKDKIVHKIDNIETINDAKNVYKLMAEELFGEFVPI